MIKLDRSKPQLLKILAIGACAGAPRERPLQTGPIETGAGSLNDTRQALEGTWKLASLEVVDHGARRPVNAGGDLTTDWAGMGVRATERNEAMT